jgi:hypothetical protein
LYENQLKKPLMCQYGNYYIRTTNDEVAKMVGVCLNRQTPDFQSAAEQIIFNVIEANTIFIRIVKKLPSHNIDDLDIYVGMLFDLAKNGAFDNKPDDYWYLASKHLAVLNEFTRNAKQHYNSKFILYGLMLLDPAIWSKPHTLGFESESRKLILHQTLIDKPLSRIDDQTEIMQVLQTIKDEQWERIVSQESKLKYVIDTVAARNKIANLQRKIQHKVPKNHSSKSLLWMKQEGLGLQLGSQQNVVKR